MENLTSRKLTWANENPRRANLPRRPFQTHISAISVHDAEFSAKKGGPVASRPAKRRYHERHFTIGNAPAKNFARRTMRTEGRKACEESVFRWQGNWGYRQKVCPRLFAGMGPRIARVELAPHHRVAPSRHGLIPLRRARRPSRTGRLCRRRSACPSGCSRAEAGTRACSRSTRTRL